MQNKNSQFNIELLFDSLSEQEKTRINSLINENSLKRENERKLRLENAKNTSRNLIKGLEKIEYEIQENDKWFLKTRENNERIASEWSRHRDNERIASEWSRHRDIARDLYYNKMSAKSSIEDANSNLESIIFQIKKERLKEQRGLFKKQDLERLLMPFHEEIQKQKEKRIQEISARQKQKERCMRILLERQKIDIKNILTSINVYLKMETIIIPDYLNDDDIILALQWSNKLDDLKYSLNDPVNEFSNGVKTQLTNENKHVKNWELGRLLSARLAEKSAIKFYQNYDKYIEDISITQLLNNPNEKRWKDFDLLIDESFPVDVKNSRRSKENPKNYVEHCVPEFKHSNRYNKDVVIAGVLSQYLWPSNLLEPDKYDRDSSVLFLGETTINKQNSLKNEFEEGFFLINFNRQEKSFLPPWIYDYPEYVYSKRNEALMQFRKSSETEISLSAHAPLNIIPICIAADIDIKPILQKKHFSKFQKSFYNMLIKRKTPDRLSLPYIYLTILKHFLINIHNSTITDKCNPNEYKNIIFIDKLNLDIPLCVYDPLNVVDSLIIALCILWEKNKNSISKFKIFKLVNCNLFLGKSSEHESWKTLIAYCGGQTINGKCGKNPLILGIEDSCTICGKLICTKCKYCSLKCKRNQNGYFLVNDGLSPVIPDGVDYQNPEQ